MGHESTPDPITLVYKTLSVPDPDSDGRRAEVPFHLDVYLPNSHVGDLFTSGDDGVEIPAVVYFHGGGLVNGNRKSWFPEWLRGRLSERGIAILSPDYRLLPSSTGHDIVEDIKDLFLYLRNDLNSALAGTTAKIKIDPDAIAVAGSSAGGLCAYLCAMHAPSKLRALLSIYGQAGECLDDHFLLPKTEPFVPGVPLFDPSDYTEFTFPRSASLPIIAEAPLEYYPPTHPTDPGIRTTKRLSLCGFYYQLGEWLDYYTGDHTLSRRLRQLLPPPPLASGTKVPLIVDPAKAREVIGEGNVILFPQLGITEKWPPTMFVHGTEDAEEPLYESENLGEKLKAVGVENQLIVVEGQPHGFDIGLNAEKEFGKVFDQAAAFLVQNIQK